ETSHTLDHSWPALRFGEVKVQTKDGQHLFEVQVLLNDLDPKSVKVELYANGPDSSATHKEMTNGQPPTGPSNARVYTATVPATRPATDYTPRVIQRGEVGGGEGGMSIPLEGDRVLWQK
ncbi:MAG: DUF3417 domain-containing protein, partial [bacterium]|nr:DUF3417 domain-containing protein [bacterium]